ncbi:TonB-dependent receptor [Shewanella sp. 202IG2-18]|uniref:TonB-dependent receptor n=1 Tax=Parashewanella hymeniacidonis TaxID=2807618 RepID=UPI00195FACAB|nr:TonB-dependent receptor [Parashewanella hymeniacidonis]MBM7073425.1 TonB-dependent receptor [Parashewanella hymeniacidonis]
MRLNVLSGLLISMYAVSGASWADADPIEVIVVKGQVAKQTRVDSDSVATPNYAVPTSDLADLLKSIPGANVNANGPVSKIAQYRGLYGDKIATSVDGLSLAGAGPNAMDAPLSYGSQLTTESIEMTRGIAPVSSGIDTIGGSLKVNTIGPEIEHNFSHLLGQYSANGNQSQLGALTNIGWKSQALLLHVEQNKGNSEVEDGAGREIVPSVYDKQQFGIKYLNQITQNHQITLSYQGVNTGDSASPALPMDIDFIDTDRVKAAGESEFDWGQMNWHIGWQNARHGMSNSLLRPVKSPMMARYNRADSTGIDAAIAFELEQWQFGLDYQQSIHDSLITNPNNPMMVVDNFKDVESQVISAYGQWHEDFGANTLKLGVRGKQYNFDAGDVSHSMAMMNPNIKYLMDKFNAQDKSTSQFGVDLVAQWLYKQSDTVNWRASVARKQSSPSYQQRYLWVPMQATGGLADGRTYIGDVDLDLETAYQTDFGFDYLGDKLTISPRVFWQKIDGYVQGVPLTDMKAKMVAKMMGDDDPLMFANTDAKLYGMDMDASYDLHENWRLTMNATYTRGERTDTDDNLYRVAPLSGQVALNWQQNAWRSQLVLRGAAKQDKISNIQKEQTSAGYGVVDILTAYENDNWLLKAGISNLLDKEYADHLGGINRVMGQEIAQGERLPGYGRQIWASVLISW